MTTARVPWLKGPAAIAEHLEQVKLDAELQAKRMAARDMALGPCPQYPGTDWCVWPHCDCPGAEYDTKRVMVATNLSLSRLLVIGIFAFDIILAIWMRWKGYL